MLKESYKNENFFEMKKAQLLGTIELNRLLSLKIK